jgi:hypothetical protein
VACPACPVRCAGSHYADLCSGHGSFCLHRPGSRRRRAFLSHIQAKAPSGWARDAWLLCPSPPRLQRGPARHGLCTAPDVITQPASCGSARFAVERLRPVSQRIDLPHLHLQMRSSTCAACLRRPWMGTRARTSRERCALPSTRLRAATRCPAPGLARSHALSSTRSPAATRAAQPCAAQPRAAQPCAAQPCAAAPPGCPTVLTVDPPQCGTREPAHAQPPPAVPTVVNLVAPNTLGAPVPSC